MAAETRLLSHIKIQFDDSDSGYEATDRQVSCTAN